MMREVSIEEPSGLGKGERSRTVTFVCRKDGRRERASAVERPNTPLPTIRIVFGVGEVVAMCKSSIGFN